MTEYVADESGAPVCTDCAAGGCITPSGYQCEAEHCQCACRDLDDPDTYLGAQFRARELDDRPDTALASIARDIEQEARPTTEELTAERFGPPNPPPPPQVTYAEWQQHRACDRKQRHPTLLDARRTILQIWREGRWAAAYQCHYCTGWHITNERLEVA